MITFKQFVENEDNNFDLDQALIFCYKEYINKNFTNIRNAYREVYKILTDFYDSSTINDFFSRTRIKGTIGGVNSLLNETNPKYIAERISWSMKGLSQLHQIDKPLYDNVVSIFNKFGYDIDDSGDFIFINGTIDFLHLSRLLMHFEGVIKESDPNSIEHWRDNIISNAPKEIVDCVLNKKPVQDQSVDWRPNETTPEDYYAL